MLGVVLLLLALVGAIVNLPCFLTLNTKPVFLKIIWRYFGTLYVLLPKLWIDLRLVLKSFDIAEFFTEHYTSLIWLPILLTLSQYLVYIAGECSYVAHALLLGGLGSTFVTVWKIASKQDYTRIEYIGIAVNVFGAYLCLCEGAPIPRIFP